MVGILNGEDTGHQGLVFHSWDLHYSLKCLRTRVISVSFPKWSVESFPLIGPQRLFSESILNNLITEFHYLLEGMGRVGVL